LSARLAAGHQVIAVDLRGHGSSSRLAPYDAFTMAADVHAVVEDAHAREPLLIGHSLGGVVATVYASQFAARGVVNVDQPLELSGFREMLRTVEPMLRGDERSFRSVIDGIMELLAPPLPDDERARLRAHSSAEQDVVLGVWDLVLTAAPDEIDAVVRETATRVKVPYLALLGTDVGDTYEPWLTSLIPTSVVEVWPGDGHYLHLVEPERFVRRVREFEATL
jgi:pimeloyl-ACP methyl ester carboxylesterase